MLAGSLGLAACGGGGGGSSDEGEATFKTSAATLTTAAEAETAAEATRQASSQAIYANTALALPLAADVDSDSLAILVTDHAADLALASATATGFTTETVEGTCGGSATGKATSETDFVVTYDDFCEPLDNGSEMLINGIVDLELTVENETVTAYAADFDLNIQTDGETYIEKGSLSCSGDNLDNCSYTSEFTGTNGKLYRVTNVSVSGDEYSGYQLSARVYDQELGYVDFNGSGLMLCSGGGFSAGTIDVSDASGTVATLTFGGCAEYTVTFKGSATVLPQN
ncbi:MAG: hypothetical protein R3175_08700 [Marinobacter sp.]|uniref:hypothetical protein n=1 Tax=Marinobacter sp. TaxID=50741 RepID=UPI00299D757E|nr:hypothetical protein [Marinobacter sp.]MDX1756122.1 hypothetical protein [Marinobacter sp.]